MKYIGENCPYCGNEFTDGDDIVVCPKCATPHHRACWFAHGECANTHHHTEGFVWRAASAPKPQDEEQEQEHDQAAKGKNLDIVCPECGALCENGTFRCPDCGAILVPQFTADGMPPLAQFRPEFNPNEDIGGLRSGDIALFCRSAGSRYITSFRKMANGRRVVWNWAAFIFTPYWFFYRKLYKAGLIFIALVAAINLWTMPHVTALYDVYDSIVSEAQGTADELGGDNEAAQKAASDVIAKRSDEMMKALEPLMLPGVCTLLIHFAAGLIANTLYRKKAIGEITRVRLAKTDERLVQAELFRNGGISFFAGVGSYIFLDVLIRLSTYFITK